MCGIVCYTALEQNRTDAIDWADNFIADNIESIINAGNPQVSCSMLILWAHISICRLKGNDLLRISDLMTKSFENIANYPMSSYNSSALILLIGSFLLFTNRFREAQKVFAPFDAHLKIAANGYVDPDHLMTYREFIRISECAFLSKLGLLMAENSFFHPSIPPLTPEMAWIKANRFFRGDSSRLYPMETAGQQCFLQLIESHRISMTF
jgi:hypothetical protein